MSLSIVDLDVHCGKKHILKSVNLQIKKKQLHIMMGPNGSGKSTLARAIGGSDVCLISSKKSKILIGKKPIHNLDPEIRAQKHGLFVCFQNPTSLTGVSVSQLLRALFRTRKIKVAKCNPVFSLWDLNETLIKYANQLKIPEKLLGRSLDHSISGGERKKIEMLQALMLSPDFAVFDEIDTGLDVDALKLVAKAINNLQDCGAGILLITHYPRILSYLKPDIVSVMLDGRIIKQGDISLAKEIEKKGFEYLSNKDN